MIVICSNPACGALLRASGLENALEVIVYRDRQEAWFRCPRCGSRTSAPPGCEATHLAANADAHEPTSRAA